MPRPLILLTNDDGYFSEGIAALFKALSKSCELLMVAPDHEQSASSQSLTLHKPLRLRKLDSKRYVADGTPTDCVMLAVHALLKRRPPDMIVSGINQGANMGDDVTYSGTIAAAIEGAILQIPSIAVSMAGWKPGMPMHRGANFILKFLPRARQLFLRPGTFLNINLPPDNGKRYRSFELTTQGSRNYRDMVIQKTDPRGREYFWIAGTPKWKHIRGSDFSAVHRGVVSVTPMKLDFTDRPTLDILLSQAGNGRV